MSGLLALLDDVAAIAKVAAASLDDVATQAAKAGAKAAGAVIDDAAVTPKYLHGFAPARELPIVWRIAKGSFRNKLLYLLPAALLLSAFAPWAITPLLMIGGGYLCYEGAEKIVHAVLPPQGHSEAEEVAAGDPSHLEERKAAGAIRTDFILSAEIMTIALAALPPASIWMTAATLAAVGIGITVLVYGGVALIVKADDIGLLLAQRGRFRPTRALGRGIVRAMPGFLVGLTAVGTAAMLWVGGAIVVHGLADLGLGGLAYGIEGVAHATAAPLPQASGVVTWLVKATLDGLFGLALGLVLLPLVARVVEPLVERLRGIRKAP